MCQRNGKKFQIDHPLSWKVLLSSRLTLKLELPWNNLKLRSMSSTWVHWRRLMPFLVAGHAADAGHAYASVSLVKPETTISYVRQGSAKSSSASAGKETAKEQAGYNPTGNLLKSVEILGDLNLEIDIFYTAPKYFSCVCATLCSNEIFIFYLRDSAGAHSTIQSECPTKRLWSGADIRKGRFLTHLQVPNTVNSISPMLHHTLRLFQAFVQVNDTGCWLSSLTDPVDWQLHGCSYPSVGCVIAGRFPKAAPLARLPVWSSRVEALILARLAPSLQMRVSFPLSLG